MAMKTVALFALAATLAAGPALADPIATPLGPVTVNEGGYLVYADGSSSNPGPLSGYAALTSASFCIDDHGSDGASSSPTCLP